MCFAPNFAQQEIALVTTYLTQFFDLKFVNPKFNKQQPVAHIAMSSKNKIEVIVTKINE